MAVDNNNDDTNINSYNSFLKNAQLKKHQIKNGNESERFFSWINKTKLIVFVCLFVI